MDYLIFFIFGRLLLYKSLFNVRKVIDRFIFLGLNILGRFLRCILGELYLFDGIFLLEFVRLVLKIYF